MSASYLVICTLSATMIPMDDYRSRIADAQLDTALRTAGAVQIVGRSEVARHCVWDDLRRTAGVGVSRFRMAPGRKSTSGLPHFASWSHPTLLTTTALAVVGSHTPVSGVPPACPWAGSWQVRLLAS